jgi:hypothetical protein
MLILGRSHPTGMPSTSSGSISMEELNAVTSLL